MSRYLTELAEKKRGWDVPVGILSGILTVLAIQVWIEDSPADESWITWLLAYLCVTALMALPLYRVVRWRLRQRDARILAQKLEARREASIPLSGVERLLGVKNAAAKLKDLKRRGFLQRIELKDGMLYLDNPEPEPQPEAVRQEPPAEEVDVVTRIRQLNDAIADEAVSARIERIEKVTASILRTIEERPERADEARRFMNYYLPTTLKLLESYRLMERQSYQGENIQAARRQIEEVLDKLVAAAEQQQDRLYGAEALDVDAEIRVLETMMASDGLIHSDAELPRMRAQS